MTKYNTSNRFFLRQKVDCQTTGKCETGIKYFSYCGRLYSSSMTATLCPVPYALLEP